MKVKFAYLLLSILFISCDSSRSAEVTIRNDIQDREYNVIEVSQIHHAGGVALNKYTLSPGNEVSLPYKNVTGVRVARAYKSHRAIYEVNCPAKKKNVLLKLIDIYLNKMPAGCVLVRVGEERSGLITWK